MHYLLGRHRVSDLDSWKKAMEADRQQHLSMGLHFEELWTNADDPQEIFFTFEVDDLERAREGLRAAGALDEEKQQRGEIPRLTFLVAR